MTGQMGYDPKMRVSMAENAIVDLIDEYPEYRGGGHGWTASVGEFTAKSTSKAGAAEALLEAVRQAEVAEEGDDEEATCASSECAASTSNICTCRCRGRNHGGGAGGYTLWFDPTTKSICQCGCGQETTRRFVPGHDARYHFAQRAALNGYADPDEYRKALRRDRAKAYRATKKAGADALQRMAERQHV